MTAKTLKNCFSKKQTGDVLHAVTYTTKLKSNLKNHIGPCSKATSKYFTDEDEGEVEEYSNGDNDEKDDELKEEEIQEEVTDAEKCFVQLQTGQTSLSQLIYLGKRGIQTVGDLSICKQMYKL